MSKKNGKIVISKLLNESETKGSKKYFGSVNKGISVYDLFKALTEKLWKVKEWENVSFLMV